MVSPGEIPGEKDWSFQPKAYWGKPERHGKSFPSDSWFKTGDIAVFGMQVTIKIWWDSIDIYQVGGYNFKLEIWRSHPVHNAQIKRLCLLLDIPDTEWVNWSAAALINPLLTLIQRANVLGLKNECLPKNT